VRNIGEAGNHAGGDVKEVIAVWLWVALAIMIVLLALGMWRLAYRSRQAEEETADMPGGGPGFTWASVPAKRAAARRAGRTFKW
jgi:hypothetical protein